MREELLPWGWEWTELRLIAARAAAISRARQLHWDERIEAAMDGIILALAEAMQPITRRELENAGLASISATYDGIVRAHSLSSGGRTGSRHAVWWHGHHPGNTASFTDAVDEKIAIWQSVWSLSDTEWQALWAAADVMRFGGTLADAAARLGIEKAAFSKRLNSARGKIRASWVCPGEHPTGRYRPGVNRIHAAMDENQRRRRNREAAA